jgi:hypothetical protein
MQESTAQHTSHKVCSYIALIAHYVCLGLQATAGVQEKEADAKAAKADYDAKVDPILLSLLLLALFCCQ